MPRSSPRRLFSRRSSPLGASLAVVATVAVVAAGVGVLGAGDGLAGLLGQDRDGPATAAPPSPTPDPTDVPAGAPPTGEGDDRRAEDEPVEDRAEPPVLDPSPSPASPAPPALDHTALAARLTEVLAREDLAVDGTVGVAVRDHRGDVVLDAATATAPLLPASTLKLVTAAAALEAFGPEHTFTTRVLAAGDVVDGTLHGDLLLIGAGDPVLSTPGYRRWVYPARPATPLEELAMRVRTAGIRHVTGTVVGVDGLFGPPDTAEGWKGGYFSDFDARRIHGLTVDASLDVQLELPEPAEGEEPDPDAVPELTLLQSADPRLQAATALTELLAERGVTVDAEPRATRVPRSGDEVASVSSPPLARLLRHTVERSDNHLADTLFRGVGQAVVGDADWAEAAAAVRRVLSDAGVDGWDGVVLADGSGLSRDDRVTAAFLADLDAVMAASVHAELWDDLMAVAGVEGTLRGRLRGTIGEGRFLGKTGTLDDVAAVAGSVVGPDARYHLAVVANDVTGEERSRVRTLIDELVLVLAEDLHDCERIAEPGATPPPSPTQAPYRLECREPLAPTPAAGG